MKSLFNRIRNRKGGESPRTPTRQGMMGAHHGNRMESLSIGEATPLVSPVRIGARKKIGSATADNNTQKRKTILQTLSGGGRQQTATMNHATNDDFVHNNNNNNSNVRKRNTTTNNNNNLEESNGRSFEEYEEFVMHSTEKCRSTMSGGIADGFMRNDLGCNDANNKNDRRSVFAKCRQSMQSSFFSVCCCGSGTDNNRNSAIPSSSSSYKQESRENEQQSSSSLMRFLYFISNQQEDEMTSQYYYEDYYNDDSWDCTFGTKEHNGIWINVHDRVGTIMASLVWVFVTYSIFTVCLLAHTKHLPNFVAIIYITIATLALASHIKTTFTDPGAIPLSAVPIDVYSTSTHAMCSKCQSYKPPTAHHCRICDRCISRMDHHCPWMNNCIGAGNLKHFILFLVYIWILCAFSLILFGINYFFCSSEECEIHNPVLINLVRIMTLIGVATIMFTTSMLTNVAFGILTGIGTIDRIKKKSDGTWETSDELSMDIKDIFGIYNPFFITYLLPIDPVFQDYDHIMGYSTPQRLLRISNKTANINTSDVTNKETINYHPNNRSSAFNNGAGDFTTHSQMENTHSTYTGSNSLMKDSTTITTNTNSKLGYARI